MSQFGLSASNPHWSYGATSPYSPYLGPATGAGTGGGSGGSGGGFNTPAALELAAVAATGPPGTGTNSAGPLDITTVQHPAATNDAFASSRKFVV